MKHAGSRWAMAALLTGVAFAFTACDQVTPEPETPPTAAAEAPPAPKPVEPMSVTLDLATLVSHDWWKPAKAVFADGSVQISTHDGNGGFSAEIPLPETVRRSGPGRVRVQIDVTKGAVSLVATELGATDKLLSQWESVLEEGPASTVEVAVADLSKPTAILFANGAERGASTAIVSSVEVVQP